MLEHLAEDRRLSSSSLAPGERLGEALSAWEFSISSSVGIWDESVRWAFLTSHSSLLMAQRSLEVSTPDVFWDCLVTHLTIQLSKSSPPR